VRRLTRSHSRRYASSDLWKNPVVEQSGGAQTAVTHTAALKECQAISMSNLRGFGAGLVFLATVLPWPALGDCVAVKYRDTPVCLQSFVCTETPQSSFVRTICYDAVKSYLLIKLNDTWYHYCAVDRTSVDSLTHASSIGSYYNEKFRSHGPVHGPFDCRDHPVPNY
jgi:hypothetical protein